MTTTDWPGKRLKKASTCSGRVAFSSDSIGRECRIGACSTAGAPTCSSGFGSGASSGLAVDQRPQLVLDRVVLRVGHHRRTPVVGVAQYDDLIGKFLNPLPNVHGPGHYPGAPTNRVIVTVMMVLPRALKAAGAAASRGRP